ncbi:uncharacterized protein LOC115630449 [Scaptodrosophila lebanonensis]|uniref:Uncharacterized protein LOC115630449 n=1 Tax=Drosophila lebanonensis TaxID=7225 RepID=A0A6J2U6W9_DROLE|nr:uncharacterized protein LOC115630449 [Scaptodrosophila lebanonensis]
MAKIERDSDFKRRLNETSAGVFHELNNFLNAKERRELCRNEKKRKVTFKGTVDMHICYEDSKSKRIQIRLKPEHMPNVLDSEKAPDKILRKELGLTEQHQRSKRFLIFPRQAPTRYQLIAGIGIPADLSYESLTMGHVLKAEFFLPYNASVYRQNPFLPEYKFKSTYLNAGLNHNEVRNWLQKPTDLRWQIYEYIEHTLKGYGYNGHKCLLEAICEANKVRFAKHYSVAAELLNLLLSPSSTLNAKKAEARDYLEAEKEKNCEKYDCDMKLLNWVSRVMNWEV